VVWDGYVGRADEGKQMVFEENAFRKMAEFPAPMYFKTDKEEKEMLSSIILEQRTAEPFAGQQRRERKEFHSGCLFSPWNGKSYTVDDFKRMLDTHPLVFTGKEDDRGEFPEQLKYAIADIDPRPPHYEEGV